MSCVAIVTGGNKGIGLAIVTGLCEKFDGIVYLTSRDEGRGLKAVEELKSKGFTPAYHQLDIDDINSIKKFGDFIKNKHGGIDCLVNNAAIAYKFSATDPFSVQAEETVRVNFTGTLNACNTLFPLLRPHARVVNVSSSAGQLSNIKDRDLRKKFIDPELTEEKLVELMGEFVTSAKDGSHKKKGWPNTTYAVSKIGVCALTRIQQRVFDTDKREDLVVNSVHPGYVDTDMTSHKGPLTIEQGAVAPLYCALLPSNIKEPRGGFIWEDKRLIDWAGSA